MSYLHCPTCQRAYNVANLAACPACGVRVGAPADPVDDIVTMAEQLRRAVARATPEQLEAARVRLGSPALPETPDSRPRALLGPGTQTLLAAVVVALLARLPRRELFGVRRVVRRRLGI